MQCRYPFIRGQLTLTVIILKASSTLEMWFPGCMYNVVNFVTHHKEIEVLLKHGIKLQPQYYS